MSITTGSMRLFFPEGLSTWKSFLKWPSDLRSERGTGQEVTRDTREHVTVYFVLYYPFAEMNICFSTVGF